MDSQADPCAELGFFVTGRGGGPGPTARIQDQHMGPIHMYVHTYIHTHARTHANTCTGRHMNVHAQADGKTYMYMYRQQTKRQIKTDLIKTCISMYTQGGTLIFSSYIGSDPASTVHPQKISGISSTPKKYLKFYQPPKLSPFLNLDLKKRP